VRPGCRTATTTSARETGAKEPTTADSPDAADLLVTGCDAIASTLWRGGEFKRDGGTEASPPTVKFSNCTRQEVALGGAILPVYGRDDVSRVDRTAPRAAVASRLFVQAGSSRGRSFYPARDVRRAGLTGVPTISAWAEGVQAGVKECCRRCRCRDEKTESLQRDERPAE